MSAYDRRPLNERVRDALSGQTRPNTAKCLALVNEQAAVVTALKASLDAERKVATDPASTDYTAKTARARVPDLEMQVERAESALRLLQRKHEELEAARPAALEEAKAAVLERNQIAAELRTEYPKLAAAIGTLLDRAARNDARLLACAAAGEAPVDLRSAEAVARAIDLPIVAQGEPADSKRLGDTVSLPALDVDGAPLWANQGRSVDPAKVPLRLRVQNVGTNGTMVHSLDGTKMLEQGAAIEAEFAMGEAGSIFSRSDLLVTVPANGA